MRAIAQDLSHYKIVGVIRVGIVMTKHGDPWEYSLVYTSNNGKDCVLYGFKGDKAFQATHARAIHSCLTTMGYHGHIEWERKRGVGKDKHSRVFMVPEHVKS